ncbi:MAG: hypothetical protein ABW321_31560 [Polyangiales bacterium]
MIGNAHQPRAQATYVGNLHGSSLYSQGGPLDDERAASMADEGGVSGAITDAFEQSRALVQRAERQLPRWWPWALLGGVAVSAAVWLQTRQRPSRWARLGRRLSW